MAKPDRSAQKARQMTTKTSNKETLLLVFRFMISAPYSSLIYPTVPLIRIWQALFVVEDC
jgi:hypothetical protein